MTKTQQLAKNKYFGTQGPGPSVGPVIHVRGVAAAMLGRTEPQTRLMHATRHGSDGRLRRTAPTERASGLSAASSRWQRVVRLLYTLGRVWVSVAGARASSPATQIAWSRFSDQLAHTSAYVIASIVEHTYLRPRAARSSTQGCMTWCGVRGTHTKHTDRARKALHGRGWHTSMAEKLH